MDNVLTGLIWEICFAYLDDIIVLAKTWPDLLAQLSQVFQWIREVGLKLQPKKFTLGHLEVAFLGHLVFNEGIKLILKLLSAIREIPPQKGAKDMRSYLGLVSYHRWFISGFAKLVAPLHALLHKNVIWHWTSTFKTAFETLKENC